MKPHFDVRCMGSLCNLRGWLYIMILTVLLGSSTRNGKIWPLMNGLRFRFIEWLTFFYFGTLSYCVINHNWLFVIRGRCSKKGSMKILVTALPLGHWVVDTCYHLLMEFLNITVLESKKDMIQRSLLRRLLLILEMCPLVYLRWYAFDYQVIFVVSWCKVVIYIYFSLASYSLSIMMA